MSPASDNETDRRVIAGRYALLTEIGRGGMGVVWRCEDRMLGREVALKRVGMTPGGAEPDLVRAEREARLAARLNHPHIVAIFDLVADGNEHWLVMEYVEGRTLSQQVEAEGPLSPEEARLTLTQAADALAAAHAADILHRDVKPSNILIRKDGSVKLTDFGIARATADATLTQTGLVTGSPAYLAPEVASGGRASAASDVWALGATMFHALEGRPPYEMGGNVMAGMYQIVHGPEPRSDKAGRLATVLEHTLVKDPEQRWTMAEVKRALDDPRRLDEARTGTATVAAPAVATLVSRARTPEYDEMEDDEDYDAEPVWTTVDPDAQHGPDDHDTMAPTAATRPVPAPGTRVAPAPLPPPAGEPRDDRPRRDRRGVIVAAVALLLLLGVVGVGALLLGGDDEPAADDAPADTGSGDASADPTEDPTEDPSEDPTDGADQSDGPTAGEMRTFVQDYLATAVSDPEASFQLLTPQYKTESGGFSGYESFWSQFDDYSVSAISPDPATGQVSYTVVYTRTDGSTTTPERVTLQLVESDGSLVIADQL